MTNYGKWDFRFLGLAKQVASWSRDPSTKTGAVIVRPDNSVCSVGFNGFPKQMEDKPEWYEDREEKYSRIVHCEVNAQIFAREPLQDYTLYTYPFLSCDRCFVQMIQCGIKRFVAPRCPDSLKERWGKQFEKVREWAHDCAAEIVEVPLYSDRDIAEFAVKYGPGVVSPETMEATIETFRILPAGSKELIARRNQETSPVIYSRFEKQDFGDWLRTV